MGGGGQNLSEDLGEPVAHRAELAHRPQVLGGAQQRLLIGSRRGDDQAAGIIELDSWGGQVQGGCLHRWASRGLLDDDSPSGRLSGLQLGNRAVGHEPARADDDHSVAQALDDVELVGGEEGGHTCGRPLQEDLAHDVHGHRVQAGEGLIENEQLGVAHQCGGQLDALLVAQRQALHLVAAAPLQAQTLGPPLCSRLGGGGGQSVEAGQVDELLGHLHPGVEAALLGHVADGASDGGVHRGTHPGHGAGVGGEHPHDDAHRGGLARPVRTDEADDLAAVQGQGEIIQGLKAPEAFGQAGQFEHRGSFGFGDGVTGPVERVHEPRTRPP